MRKRKSKPTTLKILHGNPGKRPLPEGEPMPERAMPAIPKHLDKEARAEWRRTAGELYDLGLLAQIDRAALAAYCAAWSRWVAAEGHMLRAMQVDDNAAIKRWATICDRALTLMHKFLSEFGMTPASRTRIKVSPAGGDDPLAEFLQSEAK